MFGDLGEAKVAFDPSTEEAGPGALLISKSRMEAFLAENDLALIWTAVGDGYSIRAFRLQVEDHPARNLSL